MDLTTKEYMWGVGSIIDPSHLPGIKLWLDPADANQIVFGTAPAVLTWKDKSGNANNVTQATAAQQANQVTADQNGLNVLAFTSAATTNYGTTSTLILTGGFSIFYMYKRALSTNIVNAVGSQGTNLASADGEVFSDGKAYINAQGTFFNTTANAPSGAYALVDFHNDGSNNIANQKIFFNRVLQTLNNAGASGAGVNANQIGVANVANWTDARFGDIVVCSPMLSLANIKATQNWFKNKWATP